MLNHRGCSDKCVERQRSCLLVRQFALILEFRVPPRLTVKDARDGR